jgi:hypothetical protein
MVNRSAADEQRIAETMMQKYWFFAEPLKHEATACLGPYYLASDVEALESAAVASALRVKELEKAMEKILVAFNSYDEDEMANIARKSLMGSVTK